MFGHVLIQYPAKSDYKHKDTLQFCLARHSGTFLLDAGVARQRADKSSALAESRATCCLRLAKPMCLNGRLYVTGGNYFYFSLTLYPIPLYEQDNEFIKITRLKYTLCYAPVPLFLVFWFFSKISSKNPVT